MAQERELVVSVTPTDCEIQTFRAGGRGGQRQNSRDTGVRVIHHPSGARGEAREERSQRANLRQAFVRMAATPQFRHWAHVMAGTRKSDEQLLAEIEVELADPRITLVEVRDPSGWGPERSS